MTDDVGDSGVTPAPGEEPWATYLGLPDSIINLLADIVNLCADQPTENPMTVKLRADRIETALNAWKPTSLPSTTVVDSTALVSKTIAGQLWRLCAIVLLYQVCPQVRAFADISLSTGSAVCILPYVILGARYSIFSTRSSDCPTAISGVLSLSRLSWRQVCRCRTLTGRGR